MGPRAEHRTFLLALAGCVALTIAAGWGRWRPLPLEVVADPGVVAVQVVGAVARPGGYVLPWGSRVDDLLAAAGGATPDAALELVTGAALLTDGASVAVPRATDPDGDARIDVNAASVRLLETLPGVGPVTAVRIVAARPFHSVDDLARVPGIGPVRLEALRDRVTVGGG
ncbi:MAG: ComEA family DNA-binding protein [Trueperaceae bacterium]|nr:ComEA family DNA-binding protein [Trueperaceae bacterium]